MVELGKRRRSTAAYASEAALMSAVRWLRTGQIAVGFRAMSFVSAMTSGGVFLIARTEVGRSYSGFRESAE